MDIIVTKRLTLRPPLEVDADAIFEACSNPSVARMLGALPHPYTYADAQEFAARERDPVRDCVFTIHRERLIGCIGVELHGDNPEPSLGYWLAEPWWGRGYISEATRAVLAHAFRQFDCEAIGACVFDDNPVSRAVLERHGFGATERCSQFQKQRGETVPMVRMRVKRATFERMFGRLDERMAA